MAITTAWGEEITVSMEIGFITYQFTLDDATLGRLDGAGRLDGSLEGVDVSEYCLDVSISRGRNDQTNANFNTGVASITLLNRDRRFDPNNTSSPYWDSTLNKSGVTPRRRVTIQSGSETLFVGRITDIDINYEPNRSNATDENSTITITAADDFVLLANTFIPEELIPSAELSGSRLEYVLDLPSVNYPALTRNIDAGSATLGGGAAFAIPADQQVLTYCQKIAEAEQGYFFVAANGDLTFTDRLTAAFATISANFSDTGTNIPYTGLTVQYGQELLYNKVVCNIVGGNEQIADDAASQTEYGISTYSLHDLLLSTDASALTLANYLLNLYKEPEYRFDTISSIYNALTPADQVTLSGLDISDVIEITRTYATGTPSSVTDQYSIENIKHTITPSSHTVQFGLAVADLLYPFTLDSTIYGTLNSTNALT